MNTNKLIQILSSESMNDRNLPIGLRLLNFIVLGGAASFILMLFTLGIQADLIEKLALPRFWIKFFFALALLVIGLIIAINTSRPGDGVPSYSWLIALPVAGIWLIAIESIRNSNLISLSQTAQGGSWKTCSLSIACLSIPIFIALFWALKEMAPTRPALTGFWAGLFSGGLAACIYCLHCPELAPLFVAIWYLMGMLIPAIVGAILSERLLSW